MLFARVHRSWLGLAALAVAAICLLPLTGTRAQDAAPDMQIEDFEGAEDIEQLMAEIQKQEAEAMRKRLDISEEDFEAIAPLIKGVQAAIRERDMVARVFLHDFEGGDVFFGGADGELSKEAKAVREAMAELGQALEDGDNDEIKDALKGLRKSRAALDKAVAKAREDLRSVCTTKWEAHFVMMGLLN